MVGRYAPYFAPALGGQPDDRGDKSGFPSVCGNKSFGSNHSLSPTAEVVGFWPAFIVVAAI